MLKKITVVFGACGFLIAVLLGGLWLYLVGHTSINPRNAPFLNDATDWLWPSNVMLMAWHSHGLAGTVGGLFLSGVANGIIYSTIGFVLARSLSLFAATGKKRRT
jgi:hypothetical protein